MKTAAPAGLQVHGPFTPIFLGLFCCHLGIGITLAVLPLYVTGLLGGTEFDVGLVMAAIAVAAVITRPVAGRLSDRIGPHWLMLTGAVCCALASAAYLVVDGVDEMLAMRALHGIGEGCVFTAGTHWLTTLAPPARQSRILSLYSVVMWLGLTFGALLGAALMRLAGFGTAWLLCSGAALLGLAFIVMMPRPVPAPVPAPTTTTHGLFPASAVGPSLTLALASMGYASLASFVSLALVHRGIEHGILAFSLFGLAYVGARLFLGHWPDQFGPYRVALGGALMEALGLGLVCLAPSLPVALAGGLAMGLGLSLLYPSLSLVVVRTTEASQRGAALGLFTSCWDLGAAAGSVTAGLIASRFGYPFLYATMLLTALLCAVSVLAMAAPHLQVATAP